MTDYIQTPCRHCGLMLSIESRDLPASGAAECGACSPDREAAATTLQEALGHVTECHVREWALGSRQYRAFIAYVRALQDRGQTVDPVRLATMIACSYIGL